MLLDMLCEVMVGYKKNMCLSIEKHFQASQDEKFRGKEQTGEKNRSNNFGTGYI